jgi:lysophospholipase L1-like esterase
MPTAEHTPTAEQWRRVAALHILFGHQSVGGNILAGVQSLALEQQIPLQISESRAALSGPGIQHFKVGRNEDPNGKLTDFRNVLSQEAAAPIDIALLKFCFIDFAGEVDPNQLARNYIATLDELTRAYPNTIFIPMTSPLTTLQTGPRAWLKKLLGKEPGGYASNARRHAFNEALRARYDESKRLFDIAALESNRGQSGAEYRGARIESLNPGIASDDGHLNEAGERLLGGALISHLATVSKP